MKTRLKIYTALMLLAALFLASQVMAASAEMPVTACFVSLEYPCACPNSTLCEEGKAEIEPDDLAEIEPDAGDEYPVSEWTPEDVTIEHFE